MAITYTTKTVGFLAGLTPTTPMTAVGANTVRKIIELVAHNVDAANAHQAICRKVDAADALITPLCSTGVSATSLEVGSGSLVIKDYNNPVYLDTGEKLQFEASADSVIYFEITYVDEVTA